MARKKEPTRRGRPPVEISPEQLEALGMIHATIEEAAAFFSCTRRTIHNRLKDPEFLLAYENGKAKGRLNLRRLQWRHANTATSSASVNMTIHLSKHWLGETDKPAVAAVIENHNTAAVQVEVSGARERIAAKLSALSERIEGRVAELAVTSGAQLLPREPVSGGD
ncbi:hypothetical protein [Bradyrhizobium lablabi]|uniref:hypothetical protein n=1 Tax=Bradyrhizobium lablabi TaxID=722472 RepID=UPI002012F37E|nr:hypothetical protein [Bradyrhizobium lablabi]